MSVNEAVMAMAWFVFLVGLSGILVYFLFNSGDD